VTSPALFIDKDGTLVENLPMNVDPARIQLMPGAEVALFRLWRAGYRIVVVSNQAGVAFGDFHERALDGVEQRLRDLLGARGVTLDGFYYCPHHPEATVAEYRKRCRCRKPAPGLLRRAATALDIDLERSWMVGDILDDVEAGHRAGVRSILFDSGGESEWKMTQLRKPDRIVRHLADVPEIVLGTPFSPFTASRQATT
jgi:histidinol-phosphate phosphatase family protein